MSLVQLIHANKYFGQFVPNRDIDYTEFISATINKSKLLTKERLKTAFDHFDKVLKFYF